MIYETMLAHVRVDVLCQIVWAYLEPYRGTRRRVLNQLHEMYAVERSRFYVPGQPGHIRTRTSRVNRVWKKKNITN